MKTWFHGSCFCIKGVNHVKTPWVCQAFDNARFLKLGYQVLICHDVGFLICWSLYKKNILLTTSLPTQLSFELFLDSDRMRFQTSLDMFIIIFSMVVEVGETKENDGWHDTFNTNTMKDDIKFCLYEKKEKKKRLQILGKKKRKKE